jgi:leader peptidase (prepilin peptidase)/N-methyltransferase
MTIVVVLLALLIGSFLNVCIYRLPREESIVFPASHCTECGTKLKPVDLIPVLSYFILKGKCSSCGSRISAIYPLIELLNVCLYLLIYMNYGMSFKFAAFALLASTLITITFIDIKHQIIPDGLIVFLLITGLAANIYMHGLKEILGFGIGFILGGGIFLLIAIATNGAMGGGDIKLMAALGLWFGWKYIIIIGLLSFTIGALVSLTLIILKLKTKKDYIPFGPFISISAYICIFFGDIILQSYLSYFI